MQQPELFTVALILWGGILLFLAYLMIRMKRIENALKRLPTVGEE